MKYRIADLNVEFEPKFDMLKKRAEKYQMEGAEEADFEMLISENTWQREKAKDPNLDLEVYEYMQIGWQFYTKLLERQGCLLHASAVVVDDEAYLFSADCGTGKSTHTSLWLKYLADKNPYILNDDKPAIRVTENGIFAYGTPFSGKHDISRNEKVALKAICFIEQSKVNFMRKVEPKEAIELFFGQTIRDLKEEQIAQFFDVLEKIIKEIPIYKLYCDRSKEAVELSYQTMKGDRMDEN